MWEIILWGWMSFATPPKLTATAEYRRDVLNTIDRDISSYDCLLGVPDGFSYLINEEVYFMSDKFYGPYLVVDVEGGHEAVMKDRGLIADANCKFLISKEGYLVARDKDR